MKRFIILLAFVLLLATAACTMPVDNDQQPFPTPTTPPIGPPIITPADPTAAVSPTLPPTSTPPATPTAAPTTVPSATLTSPTSTSAPPLEAVPGVTTNPGQQTFKVRFPRSRTGVTLSGTLPANDTHTYLIRALQDQHLIAEVFAPRNDLVLALRSQTGALLTPEDSSGGYYLWRLPSNQEYRLQVIGASQASDYRLAVNIPRVVRFSPGAYGTIENGLIGEGETLLYRLRAAPGQTMTLRLLNVAEGDVALGVQGLQSGQTILAPEAGQMEWRGELPTGNTHFLVQVAGLAEGETRFSLEIDIR